MMRKLLYILLLLIFVFIGCKEDNDLNRSVLIRDPKLTDLPAYSEWGYNTFGAYYDREVFISNNQLVPVKVLVKNNTTSFLLSGQKGAPGSYYDGGYYYYYQYDKMSITFKLSGFSPKQYSDLVVLNDSVIDLKDPLNQVLVSIDTVEYTADILSGKLTFKRAQNLQVDDEQIEVILSGYFEFKAVIDKLPVTITEGRFDVGIGKDNFFNL